MSKSTKAIQYENDLLEYVANMKKLVLSNIQDPEVSQDFIREINGMFERAHRESRKLRKALAFLHDKIETGGKNFRMDGEFSGEDTNPGSEGISS